MRIVLIHRYFWPDTPPYAHILRAIAEGLAEAGHHVTVLTCQPSYNRSSAKQAARYEVLPSGVEVRRWSVLPDRRYAVLKAVNLLFFCGRLLTTGRKLGPVDVVMAASFPPIAVAKVASWLAKRKDARFLYHKQDIYPDVMTATGIMREGLRTAMLRSIDARTERAATRVVVLSDDMAETIVTRGASADQVAVINNFDPWTVPDEQVGAERPAERRDGGDEGRLRVVFAGNLGRFQNLETVITAAVELVDDSRVVFHFFGDGALRPHLEREVAAHRLTNVHVHGYQHPGAVADFLRNEADLGIVSLAPGVVRTAYPSKTMSYLRQGCPILALVEADSDLADTIRAARAGYQANPNNPTEIAAALRRLADEPAELRRAGHAAQHLYLDQFSRERQLARWMDLFDRCAQETA